MTLHLFLPPTPTNMHVQVTVHSIRVELPTVCTVQYTSVHIFQLTFMSAVFLVSLAESEVERSTVETLQCKILSCYTVCLVGM